jgi:hypothetical protein
MWFKKIFLVSIISFLLGVGISAQQLPVKEDTTTLYKDIESYSKQSRFKTFLYKLVFKPPNSGTRKKAPKKKSYKKLIQKPYSTFEGKTIRKIDIVSLDPFGYSVNDTLVSKQNFLRKTGNVLHIKTQGITIGNLLLVRKNQKFNSLLVKESERLIRVQKFVHEVSFYVVSAGEKTDSVDIFIRSLDKWSIIPEGSYSGSGYHISLRDINFMGLGHESANDFKRNRADGINAFITDYFIPNIRNSYINAKIHYGIDGYGYFNRSIKVERPFFSSVTKWAAGISFASQFKKDSLEYIDTAYIPLNLKFKTQDYWLGRAWQIFRNNSEADMVTNLVLAARYLRIRYSERPSVINDPLHSYSNEDFYLGEIGISSRKYVQDKYIFKFGVIEDVPVGKVFALTAGYQVKTDSKRLYFGARFSLGNYYEWGYLSSNLEYGTFFRASHTEQGVFTGGLNYFTGLIELGKWKFRQFVKPQVTIGLNRFSYDSLTLKEGYGLDGFNSTALSGNSRLLLTLQTQSYAPWSLLGFHFGPYVTYTLGMLGDAETGFRSSKVYSQIGLGVLLKNENLVFNTFQISISFYPLIPGVGSDVMKMNSYRTTDFGFRDFEMGKPSAMIFR